MLLETDCFDVGVYCGSVVFSLIPPDVDRYWERCEGIFHKELANILIIFLICLNIFKL